MDLEDGCRRHLTFLARNPEEHALTKAMGGRYFSELRAKTER
jgi:hypothetical protein